MTPQQHLERIREIFLAVKESPPENRAEILNAKCGDDLQLRAEVEAILDAGEKTGPLAHPNEEIKAAATQPATSVPGYRIHRTLGDGGQGIVYLATQLATGRRVALKVLKALAHGSPKVLARFEREIKILAALDHPNVVSIVDRGFLTDGSPFLAMDFINGVSLATWITDRVTKSKDPSASAQAIPLFITICDAVNAAHLQGVTHRDLKPANILIDEHDVPHIVDFGLAHTLILSGDGTGMDPITMTGHFMGSLPWASPEQANGQMQKIDTRSDVYSLGVILYQLVTGGKFPYQVAGTMREVLDNILTAQPPPPSSVIAKQDFRERRQKRAHRSTGINRELDAIVLKALAKRRDDRYQNAGELKRDLENYLAGRPSGAMLHSLAADRRNFLKVSAILLISAMLVGAGVYIESRRGEAKTVQVPTPATKQTVQARQKLHDDVPNTDADLAQFWDSIEPDPRMNNPSALAAMKALVSRGPDLGGEAGLGIESTNHPLRDAVVAALLATAAGTPDSPGADQPGTITVVDRALDQIIEIAGPDHPIADRVRTIQCRLMWGAGKSDQEKRDLIALLNRRFSVSATPSLETIRLRDSLLMLMVLTDSSWPEISSVFDEFSNVMAAGDGTPSYSTPSGARGAVLNAIQSREMHQAINAIDQETDCDWTPSSDSPQEVPLVRQVAIAAYKFPYDGFVLHRSLRVLSLILNYELVHADWGGMPLANASLGILSDRPNLKFLNLGGTHITDAGLTRLKGLTQLEDLNLDQARVTGGGLSNLIGMTSLKHLSLVDTSVGDDAISSIKALPRLEYLVMDNTHVKELKGIEEVQSLTGLLLNNNIGVSDGATRQIKLLKHLEVLSLCGCSVTDFGVAQLAELKSIKNLGLYGTHLTDRSMAALGRIKTLTNVNIGNTGVTDAGLKEVGALPELNSLDVGNCNSVTAAGICGLDVAKNLELLSVDGDSLDDDGLAMISKLNHLTYLVIGHTNITDAGVQHLTASEHLDHVLLDGTEVTDAGIRFLSEIPSLKYIEARDCPGVTEAGVAEICKAHPRLVISR